MGRPDTSGMAYLSGWCGLDSAPESHVRCGGVCKNGVRAATRYVLCRCACHDGDETARSYVLAVVGEWPVAAPLDASTAEMSRFIDTINAIARPRTAPDESED